MVGISGGVAIDPRNSWGQRWQQASRARLCKRPLVAAGHDLVEAGKEGHLPLPVRGAHPAAGGAARRRAWPAMKFGNQLARHHIQEWTEYYLNYKKLTGKLEKSGRAAPAAALR